MKKLEQLMFTEAKYFSLFTLFQRCCMMKKDGNKFLGVVSTQNIFTFLSRCYTTTLSQQRLWCTSKSSQPAQPPAAHESSLESRHSSSSMQHAVYSLQYVDIYIVDTLQTAETVLHIVYAYY